MMAASDAAKARAEAMLVAQQFRAEAIKCIRRATRVTDPEYKELYYYLASQWTALAAEVDARAAEPASPFSEIEAVS
jgi:hypothetical protein